MTKIQTITFKLSAEQVLTIFEHDLRLTIMPNNDNLSFRLCSDYGIITDGVDYKNVSTMQAAINKALRWHYRKVKLVVLPEQPAAEAIDFEERAFNAVKARQSISEFVDTFSSLSDRDLAHKAFKRAEAILRDTQPALFS